MISCGQDIKPDEILRDEIEFKLTIYAKPSNSLDILSTKSIPKNSKIINELEEWLTRNSDGWRNSIISYTTPDISLIGKDFRLLIFENLIVIGFTDTTGKSKQFTKQVAKKELEFLTKNH